MRWAAAAAAACSVLRLPPAPALGACSGPHNPSPSQHQLHASFLPCLFGSFTKEPEAQLNPKKKQFEKIAPELKVDAGEWLPAQ